MKDNKNTSKFNRCDFKDSNNPYCRIPTHIFNDDSLDGYATHVIVLILSNSDSYIINREIIQKRAKISDLKFRKAWNLLIKQGYIVKEPLHRATHWIINDNPYGEADWSGKVAEEAAKYLKKGLF